MKDSSLLLDLIGDSMKSRVLDYLLTNRDFVVVPEDIAKETRDSPFLVEDFLNFLVEKKVLIKKEEGYVLDLRSRITRTLIELDDVLIMNDLRKKAKEWKW